MGNDDDDLKVCGLFNRYTAPDFTCYGWKEVTRINDFSWHAVPCLHCDYWDAVSVDTCAYRHTVQEVLRLGMYEPGSKEAKAEDAERRRQHVAELDAMSEVVYSMRREEGGERK